MKNLDRYWVKNQVCQILYILTFFLPMYTIYDCVYNFNLVLNARFTIPIKKMFEK